MPKLKVARGARHEEKHAPLARQILARKAVRAGPETSCGDAGLKRKTLNAEARTTTMVLDILPDAWHAEKEPDGGDDLLGPVEDIATDDIYSFELPVPDTPVNPLDLLCALLLSSDTFLKQEVLLKMSLCQFALQFVLPDSENHYHTFLLWALQGIMQTCSFQPPRGLRSFREDSGVLSRVPTFAPFMCMDDLSRFLCRSLESMFTAFNFSVFRSLGVPQDGTDDEDEEWPTLEKATKMTGVDHQAEVVVDPEDERAIEIFMNKNPPTRGLPGPPHICSFMIPTNLADWISLIRYKKYASPYRVLDALVFDFLGFRMEKRQLPVLWHQCLLTLAQCYKADLATDQKEALLELL
ncbi:hypothetical protein NN561_019064 [Cricetulus griseus]